MNDRKSQRILIVDDSVDNLQVLMGLLKDDYKIIAATNGEKALQLAAQDPAPDLILLDVMMPEMDGYEVCRRLKGDERTSAIPVIFVTALGSSDDKRLGFEVGAADYLTKPVVPELTRARIRNHLELKAWREFGLQHAGSQDKALGGGGNGVSFTSDVINRVLLVEDNEINIEVIRSQLEQLSLDVTTAANGREALELFGQISFDLVLTDLDMPVMNGYELVQSIRAQGAKTPVIAITASDMELSSERAESLGFHGYLLKPISEPQLLRLLEELTASRS